MMTFSIEFKCSDLMLEDGLRPKRLQFANGLHYQLIAKMSAQASPIRRLEPIDQLEVAVENERLNGLLHAKNIELKEVYEENKLLKLRYEDQIVNYENTILCMEKELIEARKNRQAEFHIIKQRYDRISGGQSQGLNNYHEHEMEFLLKQLASLRADVATKEEKLVLKQSQLKNIKKSYEREIEAKNEEISQMNRTLLTVEQNNSKQMRQLANQRELERSRTSGIVSSTKENHQFMEKQMRKLNEELLDKAIKIESHNRELNKLRKKNQEDEKNYLSKMEVILREKEEENREREDHFARVENTLKQEILQFKQKQLQLLSDADTNQSKLQSLKSEISEQQQAIAAREEQIKELKLSIEKEREDHTKQITRLLKERNRRSSNLGSSRSLGSSMKDSGEYSAETPSPSVPKQMDSVRLPTVQQESPEKSPSKILEDSHFSEIQEEEEENTLARACDQYDSYIQQLKKTYSTKIQLLEHKLNEKTRKCEQKQQQVLDILTRFSPLVKIHAGEKSVEEDRLERIERHWKADLALLEILLRKYKIKVFE